MVVCCGLGGIAGPVRRVFGEPCGLGAAWAWREWCRRSAAKCTASATPFVRGWQPSRAAAKL